MSSKSYTHSSPPRSLVSVQSSHNNEGQNPDTPLPTLMACAFCASPTRKLECDGQRPSCSNCRRNNLPCKYAPTTGTAEEESSVSQDPISSNVTGGIGGEAGRASAGGQPGDGGRGGAPDIGIDSGVQWTLGKADKAAAADTLTGLARGAGGAARRRSEDQCAE
ncbi:hypothetical protein K438DRAFT_1969679 [Mycena galopus ATCC 62051]|nr:hypothetical protein K438DRAFT_1969679 [Mycena galopus ATCC 62051]